LSKPPLLAITYKALNMGDDDRPPPRTCLKGLPAELRLKIFGYVPTPTKEGTERERCRQILPGAYLDLTFFDGRSFRQLCQTCKLFNVEAMDVFHKQHLFDIELPNLSSLYPSRNPEYPGHFFSQVERLKITIGAIHLCRDTHTTELAALLDMGQRSYRLRTLSFKFNLRICVDCYDTWLHFQTRQKQMEEEVGLEAMVGVKKELQRMAIVVDIVREVFGEKT
jgi:hypothetical protein